MKKIYLVLFSLPLLFLSCEYYGASAENPSLQRKSVINNNSTTIDFENYNPGDIVTTIAPGVGKGTISVFGTNPTVSGQNVAMIFDSSNPTGYDYDLGTPNFSFGGPGISEQPELSNNTALENVLILSEDLDASDPDDCWVPGAKYAFDFTDYDSGTVTLVSFDLLDLDMPTRGESSVTLYGSDGSVLLHKPLIPGPNNGKQTIDLESTGGVASLEIMMQNSGAIDNIILEDDCPFLPCSGGGNEDE